jgi:hypothetical protein
MNWKHGIYTALIFLSLVGIRSAHAEDDYAIGDPTTSDIWVDPVHGSDLNSGKTRALAVKTLQVAIANIPTTPQTLNNTGFNILLVPGVYPVDKVPTEILSIWGTAEFPVILRAADDTGAVILPSIDLVSCKYFYFIGLHFVHTAGSSGSYGISFRGCDHILLRNCAVLGADSTSSDTVNTGIVFNVCQNVYVERSEISIVEQLPLISPSGTGIDFYAAQYGHIKNCLLHDCGGNGVLVRGGSAYLTLEENTMRYIGLGGIRLGIRDTLHGLDDMTLPWVHYDSYDIKCVNNLIHHTGDAGFTCGGGYNILFAFNTTYETGRNSSLLVLNLARRGRAIDRQTAQDYISSGAWGTWYLDRGEDSSTAPIPNKNIFIYNNVFANSLDSSTSGPHFSIAGPYTTPSVNASCPRPAVSDDNLQIKGNIIWNGSTQKPLGVNGNSGCQSGNAVCNEAKLIEDNTINQTAVAFVDTAAANFRPKLGSIILTSVKTFPIPDFTWTGLPASPVEPAGRVSNAVTIDIDSNHRTSTPIAGAYTNTKSSVLETSAALISLENYPNPFRYGTRIAFHLPERMFVHLEIYSLLGERISTVISSALDEGDHEVLWNPSGISAGTYFCRLSADGIVTTKRLTVLP